MSKNEGDEPGKLLRSTWEKLLSSQKPVSHDPDFPHRPQGADFDLMSRIARALDDLSRVYTDAVPQVVQLLGANIESLDYMVRGRIHNAMALLRRSQSADPRSLDEVLSRRLQAAWIDGWVHGALYLAETRPLKEDLDER